MPLLVCTSIVKNENAVSHPSVAPNAENALSSGVCNTNVVSSNVSVIISGEFPAFDAETQIVQPIVQEDQGDGNFEEGAFADIRYHCCIYAPFFFFSHLFLISVLWLYPQANKSRSFL